MSHQRPPEEQLELEEEELYNQRFLDILVFRLGGEPYACPILQVQEIVEPVPLKSVPQTREVFRGVFNLRGQIIGAFDLRQATDNSTEPDHPVQAYAICETPSGPAALMVDKVVQVDTVERSTIEKDLPLKRSTAPEYVLGFLRINDEIVTLVSLEDVLSAEEVNQAGENAA